VSSEKKRVQFRALPRLIDRADALADALGEDRTDILVTALREYLQDAADDAALSREIEAAYYDDQLAFETLRQLVGTETAQRLRLLKTDLADEPLDLATPDDVDIYDGDATAVDTDDTAGR
jgi:hypothetical protein